MERNHYLKEGIGCTSRNSKLTRRNCSVNEINYVQEYYITISQRSTLKSLRFTVKYVTMLTRCKPTKQNRVQPPVGRGSSVATRQRRSTGVGSTAAPGSTYVCTLFRRFTKKYSARGPSRKKKKK